MKARAAVADDINQGFDLMHAGKSIRSVVVFYARNPQGAPP